METTRKKLSSGSMLYAPLVEGVRDIARKLNLIDECSVEGGQLCVELTGPNKGRVFSNHPQKDPEDKGTSYIHIREQGDVFERIYVECLFRWTLCKEAKTVEIQSATLLCRSSGKRAKWG